MNNEWTSTWNLMYEARFINNWWDKHEDYSEIHSKTSPKSDETNKNDIR